MQRNVPESVIYISPANFGHEVFRVDPAGVESLHFLLGEFGRMGHCRPELPFGVVAHLYCEMSHAPVYKFFCFLTFHSSVMFWTKSSFVAHLSGSNAQAPVS